jgi:hypothetical protein
VLPTIVSLALQSCLAVACCYQGCLLLLPCFLCHGTIRTSTTLSCITCFLSFKCLQKALSKLLLFDRLEPAAQAKVVEHTWMRSVAAGEILIQEGETGLAATELYVVKSGTFEVGQAASCNASCLQLLAGHQQEQPALCITQQCRSAAVVVEHVAPTAPTCYITCVLMRRTRRCWSAARMSACASTPRSRGMCLARCHSCTTAPAQPLWPLQMTQWSGF